MQHRAVAAYPGSLAAETLADLTTYQSFLDGRDLLMETLWGIRLPRSLVRDTLVRTILIEFGHGEPRNVTFYQHRLAYLASSRAIRAEISRLAELDLIILSTNKTDRRAALIIPTQRLVDWYTSVMPKLYDEVRRFMDAREVNKILITDSMF